MILNRNSLARLVGIGALGIWLLWGCGPDFTKRPRPARQPVLSPLTGRAQQLDVTLAASMNCAEIGETVAFTLTLENLTTRPITLPDSPSLDITISPSSRAAGPGDVQAWSDDPAYPQIDPVIGPTERREYTWAWTADPRYASTAFMHEDGVVARLDNSMQIFDGSTSAFATQLTVGVRSMSAPTESGMLLCADLAK